MVCSLGVRGLSAHAVEVEERWRELRCQLAIDLERACRDEFKVIFSGNPHAT